MRCVTDSILPLEFISSNPNGEEIGACSEDIDMDMEIGDQNDFELTLRISEWTKEKYWYGNRIFIPGTEYGGIIEDIEVNTRNEEIVLRGKTWRGLLSQKVVEPPDGEEHLTVSGDLNSVIRNMVGERFGALICVSNKLSGVSLNNWKVDRYVTLYDAIMKPLEAHGYRLQITYIQPADLEYGYVELSAVLVNDFSSDLEYSRDAELAFKIRDCRSGINHLVCAGKGQNEERIVLHLYAQEDGNIGKTQYYKGLNERTAVYDFSSADAEKLEEDGTKRLRELQNYKSIEVFVCDTDLELGDVVGGYEQITETRLQKPVTGKILNIKDGQATIEYEIKGDG